MHRLVATLVLAAISSGSATAQDGPKAGAKALGDSIESCVDTTTIRFGPTERRAVVDAQDTVALGEAFFRRYPAFARSSPPPDAVVLWDKPGNGWVYVALLANPDKPSERCFTASFSAARFSATEALLKKYFGVET